MNSFQEFIDESTKCYSDTKAHETFLYGHCRSFAHALHSKIGGEIKALHKDGKELHVYVHKNGQNYDVKGKRGLVSMIKDMDGSLELVHRWKEQSVDHPKMKTKPKMVDNANKYIEKNKHKFGI